VTPSITASVTPSITPSVTPTIATTKEFSAWSKTSGPATYLGNSTSGTIYGGFASQTIITGTLVVTGASQNVSVCVVGGGSSSTVSATCDLNGGTYSFSATRSAAGGSTCDTKSVAPGTYSVVLRGTFSSTASSQSVYIN